MTRAAQLYLLLLILFMVTFFCSGTCQASGTVKETSDAAKQWRKEWLTPKEQLWLSQHKIITHGMVGGRRHMPFEYTDNTGKHQGLTSDYLKIISEKLGIEITSTLRTPKFIGVANALREGKIDFASYLPKTTNLQKEVHFSKAIIKMPVVLLGRQDAPIIQGLDSLQSERVAVQFGSYAHAFLARNHPSVDITFVKTTIEGLQALDDLEVDVFIHNVFSAEYYQRKLGITGLKALATTPYDYEIMFAMSKPMAPLIPIIEKAISDISEREKRLIFDKWVNIQIEKKLDVKLLIQSLLVVAIIVTLIIALFTYWNRRLAEKVAEIIAMLIRRNS